MGIDWRGSNGLETTIILAYLRFALGYLVLFIGAIPIVLMLIVLLPFRVLRIRGALAMGRYVSYAVMACIGVKVRFEGTDPKQLRPAIFIANHTSTLDVFLFAVSAPTGSSAIIKKEMVYVPILGQLALLSGHLLIDRHHRNRALEAIAMIGALVRAKGLSVFIMPEGTRSTDGSIQPFKRGFVHLACATGLPVVPLVFHGAAKRWPMGAWTVDPGEVCIEVLDPISSEGWSSDDAGLIADQMQQVFTDALSRFHE